MKKIVSLLLAFCLLTACSSKPSEESTPPVETPSAPVVSTPAEKPAETPAEKPAEPAPTEAPAEKAEKFEQILQEKYGDRISVYRSEPFFIELMPKGVDKASSIDRMLSTVGLTRENTICCGDGYNDLTMIEYAGVGVAMANNFAVIEVSDLN